MENSITMKVDKVTKNAIRYTINDDSAIVSNVYIKKVDLPATHPTEITVTIEWSN